MPITARIELLKLRYFWRICHSNENNLAFCILRFTRKNLNATKVGFAHEIFMLCKKLNCLNVWLKLRKEKENPLNTIKKLVESHYLRIDLQRFVTIPCIYTSIFTESEVLPKKGYRISNIFSHFGAFPHTKGRIHFIYAVRLLQFSSRL